MENKKEINLTAIFSRDEKMKYSNNVELEYTKLEKIFKLNDKKSQKFDFLYAMHESFYFFQENINDILEKWNKTQEMTEPEFLYTAIAFKDAIEKIDYFSGKINSKNIPKKFENIVKTNVFKGEPIGKIKKFDWSLKKSEILQNLGAINFKDLKNKNELDFKDINVWYAILNNVRNKLIHPNSENYKVIHIGGNRPLFSSGAAKKFFHFLSSFANNVYFLVKKNIFLEALIQIQEESKKLIPIWNEKINEFCLKGVRTKIPETLVIEQKLKNHNDNNIEYHPILMDQYEMVKLYKVYEVTKNEYLKKFIILKIKIHTLFNQAFNDEFENSWLGNFSLHNLRSNFIKENHANSPNSSSDAYAIEKIGQRNWSEDEIRAWFPGISAKIDLEQPGNQTYNTRIYAIISKKVNWKRLYEDTKKQFEIWMKLNPQELYELKFEYKDDYNSYFHN